MNEVNVSADCADKRKADGKLNNKGFSLVEMLIALTIGGIVLSALVVLIQSSVLTSRSRQHRHSCKADADIALNQVENDIMEADMLICIEVLIRIVDTIIILLSILILISQGTMVIYGIKLIRYYIFQMISTR